MEEVFLVWREVWSRQEDERPIGKSEVDVDIEARSTRGGGPPFIFFSAASIPNMCMQVPRLLFGSSIEVTDSGGICNYLQSMLIRHSTQSLAGCICTYAPNWSLQLLPKGFGVRSGHENVVAIKKHVHPSNTSGLHKPRE